MKPNTVVYLLVAILVFQESAAWRFDKKQTKNVLAPPTNDFSQRLYQQMSCCGGSLVYSPYSIHSALTMTSHGARGNTLTEMNSVLGLSNLGGKTKNAYHDLILQLNKERDISLHTANGLFVNPKYEIESRFVDDVTKQYFATVKNIDFQAIGGPEKIVNAFVAEKTENQIRDILPRGTITQDTLLVLVNTIFLNASWAVPFSKYKTKRQTFHLLDGTQKQVDMMHDVKSLNFKHDTARKADVVEMAFKGNRFGLYIVLPTDIDGLSDLENTLASSNGVDDLFDDLQYTYLNLSIPKFKIESTLDLIPTLKDMGMKKAFTSGRADFSGITPKGSLYIDHVIHQAVIDVGESGTVASAATVIVGAFTSAIRPPSTQFIADHPFLFFLRHSKTGHILFQGKFSG